jgi:hypothetical protein
MFINKERSNKVIGMLTGLIEYIDSFDSDIEKKINMEAAAMTMIDVIAEASNETPFETLNQ